ncbi:MAG: RNA polymerase sigma factor [Candidatus Buchananbacteria bacterium]
MPKGYFKQKILLHQLKAKDKEAFAEFYDSYVSRIYRFIFFKVSAEQEAQDLTSEVFLKTWQYLNEGGIINDLNAWIYRLARNAVIDWYRKQNKEPLALDEQAEDTVTTKSDEQVSIDWEVVKIKEDLFKLKDEYREVLVMRFLDELEISEIAKALEKSKGAVRVLIHRALNALKEIVNKNVGPTNN